MLNPTIGKESLCWNLPLMRRRSSFFSFIPAAGASTAAADNIAATSYTTADFENADKVLLSEITKVQRGVQSDVLVKAASRNKLDPACCLSVSTAARSLDLVFGAPSERDSFVRGLRVLLADFKDVVYI